MAISDIYAQIIGFLFRLACIFNRILRLPLRVRGAGSRKTIHLCGPSRFLGHDGFMDGLGTRLATCLQGKTRFDWDIVNGSDTALGGKGADILVLAVEDAYAPPETPDQERIIIGTGHAQLDVDMSRDSLDYRGDFWYSPDGQSFSARGYKKAAKDVLEKLEPAVKRVEFKELRERIKF